MVSSVNSHTNATRIGWHLWEIDLRFAPGLPPGWRCIRQRGPRSANHRGDLTWRCPLFPSLLLSSLELSDTQVYAP